MIKAVNAIHTFTSRKTKLVVTRCPLGVSAPWIEIDAMIVNFGIIEQKNGCSLPVDYHHKGCGRINAPHGMTAAIYSCDAFRHKKCLQIGRLPLAYEYVRHCKHTYFFRTTKENPLIFAKRGTNKHRLL